MNIRESPLSLRQGKGADLDGRGGCSSEQGLPAGRRSYPEPNLLRLHWPLTDLGRGKRPVQPPPQLPCPSKGEGDPRNTVKGIVQRHKRTDHTSKGHFSSALSPSHYKWPTDSCSFNQDITSSCHKNKTAKSQDIPEGRKNNWKTQNKHQNQRNCN